MSSNPTRNAPGWSSPTLIWELLAARQCVNLMSSVALAVRDDRRRRSLSQRAYAAARGWPRSRVVRIESVPGQVRLCDIVEALDGTGYGLFLGFAATRDHLTDGTPREGVSSPPQKTGQREATAPHDPPAGPGAATMTGSTTEVGSAGSAVAPPFGPAPAGEEGEAVGAVGAEHWPVSELVARTGAGRRFPPHRTTVRISAAPLWWLKNKSTDARCRPPLWSAAGDG